MPKTEIVLRLPSWDLEAEVVVVGYGAAGAVAAITAKDRGAEVLILEKMEEDICDETGNVLEVRHTPNSRLSGANIYTPANPDDAVIYQKAMNDLYGIDDVPEDMMRVWAEMMCENFEWLRSLEGGEIFGIVDTGAARAAADPRTGERDHPLRRAEFFEFPGSSAARHVYNPQAGWGWFGCLARNVEKRGIPVAYGARVRELVQDPNTREVLGVIAESGGRELAIKAAKGVLLACGGFEFNMQMQASYLRVWPFRFYGNPANTGDGVNIALKAGAALWHMNNVSARVTAWWPDYPTAFTVRPDLRARSSIFAAKDRFGKEFPKFEPSYSFVIVDKNGKRFANECYRVHTFYWEVVKFDTERAEFPRIPCYLVFDEKTRREGPIVHRTGFAGPCQIYQWSNDNSREIEKGWIIKAETLSDLAERIGVPPTELTRTVADFNASCADRADEAFGRPAEKMAPLDTPPFYAVVQWPGGPNTQGGAKRDRDCRILDTDDRAIPRLYSAGEFGSMYGFLYEGGGNTGECIVSGRIAGERLAGEPRWDE